MTRTSLRTIIIEDHEVTRLGLRKMLEGIPDIELVGEAGDGLKGLEICTELRPDLVLLDIGLPRMDGIECTKAIKAEIQTRIILLTSHSNREDVSAGLAAGADAYCLKDIGVDQLASAIRAVKDGAIWLDPGIASKIMGLLSPVSLPPKDQQKHQEETERTTSRETFNLSAREQEVLVLLVEGLSNQQIAARLFISLDTVKSHMRHIMDKLNVCDRTQAAVKAIKEGLIPGGR